MSKEKKRGRIMRFFNIKNWQFDKYGIKLEMIPCYFYNRTFKSENRQKGACVFYRIRLYPKRYSSFSKAKRNHFAKEFLLYKK